tara:strand:- start:199 stop:900 length:702 start_codon:yes stop_codon:yes gene_type:complete
MLEIAEREIILDTETTGLSPEKGDRIVEIGCLELKNHTPTGNFFHTYVNPEREMSEGAFKVSGISNEFLKNQPTFKEIIDDFISFLADSPIVAHNAQFDINFINKELEIANFPELKNQKIIDTLAIAREKFPGAQASLDALCKRFNIDNTQRVKHGALLDAELLSEVYIELLGGRQTAFVLSEDTFNSHKIENTNKEWKYRKFSISEEEKKAHDMMLSQIKNPLWMSIKKDIC